MMLQNTFARERLQRVRHSSKYLLRFDFWVRFVKYYYCMSGRYRILKGDDAYFVTFPLTDWICYQICSNAIPGKGNFVSLCWVQDGRIARDANTREPGCDNSIMWECDNAIICKLSLHYFSHYKQSKHR